MVVGAGESVYDTFFPGARELREAYLLAKIKR
jgi:hypothetical protein